VSVFTGESGTLSSHYHYLLSCVIHHLAVRHSLLTLSLSPILCQSSLDSQALSHNTITLSCRVSVLTGQSSTLFILSLYSVLCQSSLGSQVLSPHTIIIFRFCQSSLGSQGLSPYTIPISCPVSVLTGQSGTLSSHYNYLLSCITPLWAVRHSNLTLSLSPVLCQSLLDSQALSQNTITLSCPVSVLTGSQALSSHIITIFFPVSFLTGQSGTLTSHYHYLLIFAISHSAVRHSLLTLSLYPFLCQSLLGSQHSLFTLSLSSVLFQYSLDSQALSPHTITLSCPVSVLTGQ
jgi:hypothetical protein